MSVSKIVRITSNARYMYAIHSLVLFSEPNEVVDCIGQFSNCDKNCESVYQIIRKEANGGKKCPHKNGYIEACEPGEGNCPNEGSFLYIYVIIVVILLIILLIALRR